MNEEERFLRYCTSNFGEECWLWLGGSSKGYGYFWFNGRLARANRVSHLLFIGPIPDGNDVHHTCRNKLCVNPNHLKALSKSDHMKEDGIGAHIASINRDKTHCSKGHLYSESNTIIRIRPNGKGRDCRQCYNERMRIK